MTPAEQANYWLHRHKLYRSDPRAVGHMGIDREANAAATQEIRHALGEALKLIPAKTALDIGCGTGRFAQTFIDAGHGYTGVDVSPLAIEDARKLAPAGEFVIADLGTWEPARKFDLVAAMFVFVHFTEDDDWCSIVERCLSWLTPGGSLLIADRWPSSTERNVIHVTSRTLGTYELLLATHGFALDPRFPIEGVAGAMYFRLFTRPRK